MYRLILKDKHGDTFCFYSAASTEHFDTVIKSLTHGETWSIEHNMGNKETYHASN